jgi:SAM-dependent methyltransferase
MATMAETPDLTDPRYLDEVGWFLYHEKYGRAQFGDSYDAERRAYSRLFLSEVAKSLGQGTQWFQDKTVVSVGCGCTGDLTAFPAAVKIAFDPLLLVYQRLGMLLGDEAGSRTVYLSITAEDLPLVDESADLVVCRNALDHMPDPRVALNEIWRILKNDGAVFISVDIGGAPTPNEPTVFSLDSLRDTVGDRFDVIVFDDDHPPHSAGRVCSVRLVARKKLGASERLDKAVILRTYEARVREGDRSSSASATAHRPTSS